MKKGDYLLEILKSSKTVFTIKDIALLWHESNTKNIRDRLYYYVQKGDLYKIRRGFYARNKYYQKFELANRIFTPSYITFETVLAREGLIFQYQTEITVAAYLSRSITIDHQTYVYRKLKDRVLMDSAGLVNTDEATIASKERAFLDTLYVYPNYHFDNLRSLNWDDVFTLLPMYGNMRLTNEVEALHDQSVAEKRNDA